MATTPILGVTLLDQSQSQKEITINEALMRLDSIGGYVVLDKDLATPPASPNNGDMYIVAASATGAWAGKTGQLAYFSQLWLFIAPRDGMGMWVKDEAATYRFNGTVWQLQANGMSLATYDAANIAQQVVGVSATQTLTNKTLTSPAIASAAMSGTHTGASSFGALQTFSAGVKVGNTAQTNAQTLDWYDEGTFTPIVIGGTTAGTGTYSIQSGRYTRIGNRVDFRINIIWSAHTGTGSMSVGGLPFTSESEFMAVTAVYGGLTVGSGKQLGALVVPVSTVVNLYVQDPAGGGLAFLAMDSAAELRLAGVYFV